MNQIEAIQAEIGALLRARNYLLNQTPSDMVALADVTEKIISLTRRQSAIGSNPTILSTPQESGLQTAIQALDNDIRVCAAANTILTDAATVIGAA
jgi:hypothetical protein